ncbi:sulfite exporter TauE/SafE family protein [Ornithinimicrobium sp. Y1847]|uniref:sulfite exporter TauE/SafE family protein n=1 Tax=unclassified Ornithinimicrobium TaxID=2615080 RepID=UPI003B682DE7
MDLALEIVIGLLVGLVMGALGAGGGIIAVPALVLLLDQPPAVATTTSLVIVGITSIVAVAQHARGGRVSWADGVAFGMLGAGGALLGSRVAVDADPGLTMGLFCALLAVVATVMWRRAQVERRSDPQEQEEHRWLSLRPPRLQVRRALLVLVVASAAGVLTGFFGVGGGFAIVPALTIVLGLPMGVAVGTSLLVIALNSATGVLGRLGTPLELDWALIAVFTSAAVVGSLLGERLGRRLDPAVLQRSFAVMLVVVAIYTTVALVVG